MANIKKELFYTLKKDQRKFTKPFLSLKFYVFDKKMFK
jgi:hypothetical protein